MNKRLIRSVSATLGVITVGLLGFAGSASAAGTPAAAVGTKQHPVYMWNMPKTLAMRQQAARQKGFNMPPFLACVPGQPLPVVSTPIIPVNPNCVPPGPPAGAPWMGNMAYFGGHVQVAPRLYMVFYGWGQKGAFKSACSPTTLVEGSIRAVLKCDPDGAGKRMADFVQQLGGTAWAGSQTQYYENVINADGSIAYQQHITNPKNQLAGIWADDTSPVKDVLTPSRTQATLGAEASRAVKHFKLKASDLADSQILVIQPQNFSDPNAASTGYCAWHDYTEPGIEGHVYDGLTPNISFTNMPYILDINFSLPTGTLNACGENIVNSGAAGVLDGQTVVLGHEIEETVTDPGAETASTYGGLTSSYSLGGWYDAEQYENGDKCAWVGTSPAYSQLGKGPGLIPNFPGEVGVITGNGGGKFPVQSLWSNSSALGAGYCAGAGTDLPGPLA